jgi:hypothetical protein
MLDTYAEFEKEFPKLNHIRSPETQRYRSRVTAEWYTWFLMYKIQEAEIARLTAELALCRQKQGAEV